MSNSRIVFSLFILMALILPLTNLDVTANSQGDASKTIMMLSDQDDEVDDEGTIIINEVMFDPEEGEYEWVELKNTSINPVSIRGWSLTDEDGNWYKFPKDLPDVPAGDFVVVVFDGLGNGSNDLDLTDHVIELHSPSGLVGVFEDDADQASLYEVSEFLFLPAIKNSNTNTTISQSTNPLSRLPIISFFAWGSDPGQSAISAIFSGIWAEGMYKDLNVIDEISSPLLIPGQW